VGFVASYGQIVLSMPMGSSMAPWPENPSWT